MGGQITLPLAVFAVFGECLINQPGWHQLSQQPQAKEALIYSSPLCAQS
jgi:hypothetical protein